MLHRILLIGFVLVSCGCGRSEPQVSRPAVAAHVAGFEQRFTIHIGGRPVQVRLAVLEAERSRGLMHVAALPEDEGMLFLFARPQRMSFYMRNTGLALDIGYFDADGVLREVYPMHPYVEDSVRSAGSAMQFALEMNQGWFGRRGVLPGAVLDREAVRAALVARGLDPDHYLGPAIGSEGRQAPVETRPSPRTAPAPVR